MITSAVLDAAVAALDREALIEKVAGVVLDAVLVMAGWQARNVARVILRDLGLVNQEDASAGRTCGAECPPYLR